MKLVLALGGLVLAGFLVDQLLLWMEWKGWIDYRRTYPGDFSSPRSDTRPRTDGSADRRGRYGGPGRAGAPPT